MRLPTSRKTKPNWSMDQVQILTLGRACPSLISSAVFVRMHLGQENHLKNRMISGNSSPLW